MPFEQRENGNPVFPLSEKAAPGMCQGRLFLGQG